MSRHRRLLAVGRCVSALIGLVTAAAAQSFNIDVGANLLAALPSVSYGAAAQQPGFWSPVVTTAQSAVALKNLATNAPTTVTIRAIGGYGDFVHDVQGWTGDDRALMADASDVSNAVTPPAGGLITWTMAGLAAGEYALYTYAAAPDFPASYATTVAVTGAAEGPQVCTGAWSGSPHVLGVSYARHTLTISAGQDVTILTSNSTASFGSINGFQIVRGPNTSATVACQGDGTGTACPCANSGTFGSGCANSGFGGGATLTSTGIAGASAGTDTLVLSAVGVTGPGLFFQATGLSASPGVFGDGLFCATVGIVRMGVVFPTGPSASYPGGTTPNPIHGAGGTVSGDTRHYQCWYRDSLTFCSIETFNLTNALTLTWVP